jgi:hypothetical protein
MTIPSSPIDPFSPFLPATYNVPEEQDRLRTFLVDKFSSHSDVINDKKIGMYLQSAETPNGNKIFYDDPRITRNGFQYLARVVAFPANGTIILPMPADINPQWVLFQAWGSASKPPSALLAGDGDFITFVNAGNPKITFNLSDLFITITTVGLGNGYTGFIILDYIRDGT